MATCMHPSSMRGLFGSVWSLLVCSVTRIIQQGVKSMAIGYYLTSTMSPTYCQPPILRLDASKFNHRSLSEHGGAAPDFPRRRRRHMACDPVLALDGSPLA